MTKPSPTISVIIPCYNSGKFLRACIESVLQQKEVDCEIIVVDDGSTDDTALVAKSFSQGVYQHQTNKGPSAARNAGIALSKGEYLVFLDADDLLVPDGLINNWKALQPSPEAAFVSGAHEVRYLPAGQSWRVGHIPAGSGYEALLQRNYIGMPGSVMFRRWVFDHHRFPEQIRYCEDYQLYLSIARHHPIMAHDGLVAVYQLHEANATNQYSKLLLGALQVLKEQESQLRSESEWLALLKGQVFWKSYYGEKIFDHLLTQLYSNQQTTKADEQILRRHHNDYYKAYRLLKQRQQPSAWFRLRQKIQNRLGFLL